MPSHLRHQHRATAVIPCWFMFLLWHQGSSTGQHSYFKSSQFQASVYIFKFVVKFDPVYAESVQRGVSLCACSPQVSPWGGKPWTVGRLKHRKMEGSVEGLPGDPSERRRWVLREVISRLPEMPTEVSLVLPTTDSFLASLFLVEASACMGVQWVMSSHWSSW